MVKRNALGKGLGALLENAETDITSSTVHRSPNTVANIELENIIANPFQPRTEFEEEALNELVDSIRLHGIIQPVTVRKVGVDKFELISGERRTRAAIMLGLSEIPAYIRLANDQEMLEMALIENIQREDLNAIEISLSYKRLLDECGLKQEELGDRVGKKRSTVNNYLRLLKLPESIQRGIINNEISMGHARALINVEDEQVQQAIFEQAVKENLSVRRVEELVKAFQNGLFEQKEVAEPSTPQPKASFREYKPYKDLLVEKLGSKVEFKATRGEKGQLIIHFDDKLHLTDILEKLREIS
ncbi:MAG: ParB/RepB/Spo0J family partition protein [Flavobacteriales bacterium]|nr:ParB/RepB/Spo0J family partition protein [Bacteroidota bacterium]MCB9239633.1 ParB/RepB/Spo0J family partition protein [Flavobacteriales bacterium]